MLATNACRRGGTCLFRMKTIRSNVLAQTEFYLDDGKSVPASSCTLARSRELVTVGVVQRLLTCYVSTCSDLRFRRCALPKPAVRSSHGAL